jgi:hypothetical protein
MNLGRILATEFRAGEHVIHDQSESLARAGRTA